MGKAIRNSCYNSVRDDHGSINMVVLSQGLRCGVWTESWSDSEVELPKSAGGLDAHCQKKRDKSEMMPEVVFYIDS